MGTPTEVQNLAEFVHAASFEQLSASSTEQLKARVLDSLGVAIGALNADPIRMIRETIHELGGNPLCTLIGGGGMSAPDRAAFYNGALVRYLDFMDSYLAPGETFHPSDNLGAVLAAAEYADRSGKEFLTALAVAYQVQSRLSEVAPVRGQGFDHTTQGAYAFPLERISLSQHCICRHARSILGEKRNHRACGSFRGE
jgi:2-methylcitrate dehydratase